MSKNTGKSRKQTGRTRSNREIATAPRLVITKSARILTPSKLANEVIGGVFISYPEDYKHFMLQYNGGVPEPGYFVYRAGSKCRMAWVDAFCSITSSDIDILNLRGANQSLANCALHVGVPYDCITIGSATGENDILLFVRGRRRTQVWLKVWDDVNDDFDSDRDTNPREGLYRLAMSFDKFLQSLCSEEEATKRVARRGGKLP